MAKVKMFRVAKIPSCCSGRLLHNFKFNTINYKETKADLEDTIKEFGTTHGLKKKFLTCYTVSCQTAVNRALKSCGFVRIKGNLTRPHTDYSMHDSGPVSVWIKWL